MLFNRLKQFCYVLFAIFFILTSCQKSDEVSMPGSQYIVINGLDNRVNLSFYDYTLNNLQERFYATDATAFFGANKRDNYVFMVTDVFTPGKFLRKIDITNGKEVGLVKTWLAPAENEPPFIDFNDKSVLLGAMDNGYRLNVKMYDENLNLLDSLILTNTTFLASMKVSNKKLFASAPLFDQNNNPTGYFIRVIDLNTMKLVKDIKTPEICTRFITMNNGQLWISQGNNFSILNTESLEFSKVAGPASIYTAPDISGKLMYSIQNGPTSNSLIAYNLESGVTSEIAKLNRNFSNPVVYDPKAQAIVCSKGVTGGMAFFSENGKLIREVESPQFTSFIFIK